MALNRDQVLQGAEKLLAKGKLDSALREYLRVLDENPKDISTLNKVGDLYVRMNRPADSIPFFTRIAEFYARDGFFLKAIAIYKKINKIDPARLEVYDRLADLYHKQGLTQDARSQYQVLADHYTKSNRPEDAIAAYKKMAAVDPNDLKIQARLADLYRSNRQIDQAVMQYGLIGSLLLRRGAHDEAAAVFQKGLELSPTDAGLQKSLVRSLLAQRNPTAAIAVLKAAPRTADSLALLAEAQLELGSRSEAARTAEQGLALDSKSEANRMLLSRVRISEGAFDEAFGAVAPAVDGALESRDFARAGSLLAPILEAEPTHRESLSRMADVREGEGNREEAIALRLSLAREAERRGDPAAAVAEYRKVVHLSPTDATALERLRELSPAEGPPRAGSPEAFPLQELVVEIEDDLAPLHAPQPTVPSLDFERDSAAPASPSIPTIPMHAASPLPSAAGGSEQDIETLVVEAEVFARYGLVDKAVERLRALVRKRPDLLRARERLIELMSESNNPALSAEAEGLAAAYRQGGEDSAATALLSRLGLAPAGSESAAEPHARPLVVGPEVDFEEFGSDAVLPGLEPLPATVAASAPAIASSDLVGGSESEFVSYGELGSLLEEEMQKATGVPPASPTVETPSVDEQSLFADEQRFFNLAEELEKELSEDAPADSGVLGGPEGGEASLEEIFREFKKGVEQQLSPEDYETHFNLGIAYKEMGLTDEAIGEFQLASKDPTRTVECCSMLGLCFLEKGMPQLAIKWYRKGLEAGDIKEVETVGLLYDLGCIYQDMGDLDLAYRTFLEVYGFNSNYRDVMHRVKDLEAVKKS